MIRYSALTAFLFFNSVSFATEQALADAPTAPSKINSYGDLSTFIQNTQIQNHPIQTIDDLLEAIKKYDPDFLYNFSLIYSSRSQQFASFQAPRVVVFGAKSYDTRSSDNHLIISFNSEGTGHDRLEVIDYDEIHAQFGFHEIIFPADNHESGAIRFDDHPESCQTCHGKPAKPIWDTYPVWPGVYGSEDDNLFTLTPEQKEFESFNRIRRQLPRYRHLDIESSPTSTTTNFSRKPNLALTFLLSQLNFKRIARQLQSWPKYKEFKYGFLGAAAQCYNNKPESFFPVHLQSDVKTLFADLFNADTLAEKAADVDKLTRFFAIHNMRIPNNYGSLSGFDPEYVPQVAHFDFYAQASGSSLANWSMVFRPGSKEFSTGQYGVFDFSPIYLVEARKDPDFKDFFDAGGETHRYPGYPLVDCDALSALSQRAIEASGAPALTATETSELDEQSPLVRCMSCHTTSSLNLPESAGVQVSPAQTPQYPFDNPVELRKLLRADSGQLAIKMKSRISKPADDPQRMPLTPHRPLSDEERRAFISFIDRLVE